MVRTTVGRCWTAEIQHQGRDHAFTLRSETEGDAATEAKIIYDAILAEGWDAALLIYSLKSRTTAELSGGEISYWKDRLRVRRYRFPPAGGTDQDWSVRIDHAGTAYWFPLGTPDATIAAGQARRIHATVLECGWEEACGQFSRELILSFAWCSSPVLWTYATIHTLVGSTKIETPSVPNEPGKNQVIIVEADSGIRRALQWCVSQNAGFGAVPCASPELFSRIYSGCKPALVLINHDLAERVGVKFSGGVTVIKPGVLALGYSVSADGDQMLVSTPGGAEGYMLKRVKPSGVFDPVLSAIRLPQADREDFLGAVKSCFKELLRGRLSADTQALARLTPRENDVLALLSKGFADKEIAHALGLSIWTVHDYIKKIFKRLHVRTRTEAVVRYLEK